MAFQVLLDNILSRSFFEELATSGAVELVGGVISVGDCQADEGFHVVVSRIPGSAHSFCNFL